MSLVGASKRGLRQTRTETRRFARIISKSCYSGWQQDGLERKPASHWRWRKADCFVMECTGDSPFWLHAARIALLVSRSQRQGGQQSAGSLRRDHQEDRSAHKRNRTRSQGKEVFYSVKLCIIPTTIFRWSPKIQTQNKKKCATVSISQRNAIMNHNLW